MSSVIRGSDNFDSAVKSGTIEATASGALANGDMVVLNSDGTVSAVSGTSRVVGDSVVFESDDLEHIDCCYDTTNNKVVVVYRDQGNSSYGTAVVGTVSGTSISFGTPVVFESASSSYFCCCFDTVNSKVVIIYKDVANSHKGTAIVGTVSGTSISFGSPSYVINARIYNPSCCFDSTNGKVIVMCGNGSGYMSGVVGTVSGTSISFGSPTTQTYGSSNAACCHDSTNNKIISIGQSNLTVCTVSGTSISFGTEIELNLGSYNSLIHDPVNNKIFAHGTSYFAILSISGTTPTLEYYDAWSSYGYSIGSFSYGNDVAFDSVGNRVCVSADRSPVDAVSLTLIDLSSNPPSLTTSSTGFTGVTDNTCCFDPDTGSVLAFYSDEGNSNYGTGRVYALENTNLTEINYIGVSDGAYSDATTATIQIVGAVDDAQTGLTTGQSYYVQADGTLSTTPDSVKVFAGTALSSTELIVKG